MKTMVFHHPYPLSTNEGGNTASTIRPVRMVEAFKEIGYNVILITGNTAERKAKFESLRQRVSNGLKVDFIYCELSTTPWPFTEANNIPFPALFEPIFWRWAADQDIPVGFFYRDVHAQFAEYLGQFSWIKRSLLLLGTKWEATMVKKYASRVFIPSIEMASFLPYGVDDLPLTELPPGCEASSDLFLQRGLSNPVQALYVGGVSPPVYNISPLLELLERLPGVQLSLITRRAEWINLPSLYPNITNLLPRISYVETNDPREYYLKTALHLMLWQPNQYLSFAVPFKLFESICFGQPILTLRGTKTAQIIETNNLGWVAANVSEAIAIINSLVQNPQLLLEKTNSMLAFAKSNQWQNRAEAVAQTLLNKA